LGVFHLFHGSVGKAVGDIHHGRMLGILLVVHMTTWSLLGSLGGNVHRGDGLVGDVNGEHSVGTWYRQLMDMTKQDMTYLHQHRSTWPPRFGPEATLG